MESKWFKLKNKAIFLRKKGLSIRYIENQLGIPRSTLSGWFKNIKLNKKQKDKLHQDWIDALFEARKKAAIVHKKQGHNRREAIRREVKDFFSDINIDKKTAELVMATFYLAEGTKKENCFVFANSNAEILKGIIKLLRFSHKIEESKLRCCLHLRKDQNERQSIKYWSDILSIPEIRFLKTQFDKRTIKKTYESYKGVCVIYYYDMALQRRILYTGEKILSIINNLRD